MNLIIIKVVLGLTIVSLKCIYTYSVYRVYTHEINIIHYIVSIQIFKL